MPDTQTQTPPPAQSDKDARLWCMLCHLAIIVPCFPCLIAIIIWQLKKKEFPSVETHGKRAVNFQLSIFIVMICIAVAAALLAHFHLGIIGLLNPLIWLGSIILGVIAGIKANNGEDYQYPWSLNLIK